MTVAVSEKSLLQRWRALPPAERRTLLEFAEFPGQKHAAHAPRESLLGLCADLGVTITAEDIDEARQEMWGNFPRDIEL